MNSLFGPQKHIVRDAAALLQKPLGLPEPPSRKLPGEKVQEQRLLSRLTRPSRSGHVTQRRGLIVAE